MNEDACELTEGLLDYAERGLGEAELQDLADELLIGDEALNSDVGPESGDQIRHEITVTESVAMYGQPDALRRLGAEVQRKIAGKVLDVLSGRGRGKAKKEGGKTFQQAKKVLEAFTAQGPLQTIATVADELGLQHNQATMLLECSGCLMLYGGAWMVGAGLTMWRSLFRSRAMIPLLYMSQMSYDETPLRMRVAEYTAFMNIKAGAGASNDSNVEVEGDKTSSSRFCKIFRLQ